MQLCLFRKDVFNVGERTLMSAVAWQHVSTAIEAMCLVTDVVNEGGHRPKERSWPRGGVSISTQ